MSLEKIETALSNMLGIRYPIIMAPMFLVSNASMIIESTKAGITGCVPALNYRTDGEFRAALKQMSDKCQGPYGINLIVNKSNIRLEEQLKSCVDHHVSYIITSLGSPQRVIEVGKKEGIKVFCDVTDLSFAQKVEAMGADALIGVNCEAGGHAGKLKPEELIPLLRENCQIPVISAGGVGTGAAFKKMLALGACGISMGSPFIATTECGVTQEYKDACVQYGAKDIVMTDKLSGSMCTIIKTPYVESIGLRQNWLESFLNKNKSLKKMAKMLTFYKGMKSLEKAAFGATYKTLWCAGPSIEDVKSIMPVGELVAKIIKEYEMAEKTAKQV